MNTAKAEIRSLLEKLPDDCSIEDVQYHLYVVEKIQQGINRAEQEGTLDQNEVERKFQQWTSK
ncbi:MAG: hypothetical protein L3K25_06385 [Gammaproteobacteria bacterium]|nr:hypothetical protein [Gammaproteobacteria bacterium]MCF6338701.1 hypothetical protein [Gammaproteobacteria bacterium]